MPWIYSRAYLELVQSLSAEIGRWDDDVGRSVPET
jgi:hypothetical protein